MKTLFKTSLILIALGGFCLSCHKYPEDPFISFRRPIKRIEGTWNITKYEVYGVDHSHDFDSLLKTRTLTDCCINFSPYIYNSYPVDGSYTFVDKDGNNILPSGNNFQFEDATRLFFGYTMVSPDSIFYNLFFYQNINVNRTNNINIYTVIELYGKKLHISRNGIDIYFKEQ
jgi:hypothetical protein